MIGVTGSYEGDEEVAVNLLVRETESMHKFQIILDFQLNFVAGLLLVRFYVD